MLKSRWGISAIYALNTDSIILTLKMKYVTGFHQNMDEAGHLKVESRRIEIWSEHSDVTTKQVPCRKKNKKQKNTSPL